MGPKPRRLDQPPEQGRPGVDDTLTEQRQMLGINTSSVPPSLMGSPGLAYSRHIHINERNGGSS